jgi:tRNA1(Val) A37 N6-methylase TrmN6
MTALNSPNLLKIEQGAEGYRYSIEPFLLADFVQPSPVVAS